MQLAHRHHHDQQPADQPGQLCCRFAQREAVLQLLVVASSSFIYVAVADLIPQLQHRLTLRETAARHRRC